MEVCREMCSWNFSNPNDFCTQVDFSQYLPSNQGNPLKQQSKLSEAS